jgi:hypothetical protein
MKTKRKDSAQEMQDTIFRNMSADKKIWVASRLWLLGKTLDRTKVDYGKNNRSTTAPRAGRAHS